MKQPDDRKGILLLELMVAMAIIATVFLFIGRAYGISKKALKRSQALLKTALLLEEKMWELEDKEEIRPGTDSGDFSASAGYGWKIECQSLDDSGLDLVNLEVFRKDLPGQENFSLATYLKDSQQ